MNPRALLEKHFHDNPEGLEIVYHHSRNVADKALAIAARAGRNEQELRFIEEAALLHDIGVARIYAPKLNCFGKAPYICHGVIGRQILDAEGLPHHALVCERHIGVGLSARDIAEQKLRLPPREMSPVTDCERIVALADLFYSKKGGQLDLEKSTDQVRVDLLRFGQEKVRIFENWLKEFSLEPVHDVPAPSN
ncbi:HD domain-containing protein [Geomonas subterranea]|uniref:HD domain-containing protein n=1 Tax=Geomonas subterranea TaxID=2847989 RepID=A0ABX8LQH0_9BACT|nr:MULTISPECIES: HD domain-containing protein [Geomonas]QXE91770.1 HD domain-containing protein [Geomonas subterranea]QXM10137.1 HD domain-containing protein [Geomonas subterranea]